ncbi:MAG: deoxyhypusine synthase [Thermoplasmata archaeon]|nr:deoxyhypusine synthase [Thermoplasmata archaeon]MBE3140502.1 deoxyhypusine synthase [Thermoplasmata archaeon]
MKYEIKDEKKELLSEQIKHIDIKTFNAIPLIEAFDHMAFQSRNLANACKIYNTMLADTECSIILCLAGSLVSAGLKNVIVDMIRNNMVDAIVSTGAIVVDQDFFEGLGFKHYRGEVRVDDTKLQKMHIDRIYDTFIDEDDLRICDMTTKKIADELPPRPYSSREFIYEMGRYLEKHGKNPDSFVLEAYKHEIPIFVPAFSDCSAGFGLVFHQHERKNNYVTIDSVKDFRELTELKVKSKQTGLFMIGGGVPKNFVQDTVVAADILGIDAPMHKYAIQLTVADERDGALSGSTLKEANSWGKVDTGYEQMVYSEATITFPLVVSYAYHKGAWKKRKQQKLNQLLK